MVGPAPVTPYDVVAYPSRAQGEAHPAHIATIAWLRGFASADVARCRVLELGCGEGRNLISLAQAYPESSFVGVDLARTAIDAGRELADELGLHNLTFVQADLATFAAEQPFDYVLAHGVYSWLAAEVRDAFMRVCRSALAPQGIVYVGYATYPGCHVRELVRDLLLFHTDRLPDPRTKVSEGLEFLRFLARVQTAGDAYARALEQETKRMSEADPNYVLHDDFAENNSPVYFAAFVEHAAQHGLAFLAESLFMFFEDPRLSPEVHALLRGVAGGDPIALEQYLDFVRCRAFRQTLLCRSELSVDPALDLERVFSLHASSRLLPQRESPELASPSVEVFRNAEGVELSTAHPSVKAALTLLARAWPAFIAVEDLFERARSLVGAKNEAAGDEERSLLARALLKGAALRAIELSIRPPRFSLSPGECPTASPLARAEAGRGRTVTTLRHSALRLEDEASRQLLGLLNGQRSRLELLQRMREFFATQRAEGVSEVTPLLSLEELDRVIQSMARQSLLVG